MLWTMAAFGLLVAWLVVVPTFAVLGVRQIVGWSRDLSDVQRDHRKIGLIDLGFAAAVGVAPFVALRLAAASTGWVDADRDGMLDGFVNGQYDLFDFVVPSAVMYGLGLIVVLVATREALRRRVTSTSKARVH
ncbi:MAG TPA: hypothetical protein VMS99_11580 [Acidimicrobiia bacterium]|nr:hypothetical protein [Acidimicrobiia bacterium]